MGLKVISDGHAAGARVLDSETGVDVTMRLNAAELRCVVTPSAPPRLEIELVSEISFLADRDQIEVYMPMPGTGIRKRVRRIEFEDGTVAEYPGVWWQGRDGTETGQG